MNVLVDTNVVLDVLLNREPHVEASSKVLKLCEARLVNGSLSALSIANLVYIMRKELKPDAVEAVLGKLELVLSLADLRASDLKTAASMRWKDFEDAAQAATAKRLRAEYIVTRNTRDFTESEVPAITPDELLVKLSTLR